MLLIELFLIPGFGIFGIAAGGCMLYANYYAFTELGIWGGVITLLITMVSGFGSLVWFMKSKTLDRVALKKNITSRVDRSAEAGVRVGDSGQTTTRLALIGYAEIGGSIVEVKSASGFIDEHTPIEVVRIVDGIVLVKQAQ